jgi:exonuclease III
MLLNLQLSVQKKQKKYYSGKKKRHTIKTQLVLNKNTQDIICIYVTKGKTHDFKAFKNSRLPIAPSNIVAVDSGYQGLQKIHKNTELPKKRSKKQKLTKVEKIANNKLASKRVFNEHVNGDIKVFKIVAERYRNRRKRFGLRMNLLVGIYNFELNCA